MEKLLIDLPPTRKGDWLHSYAIRARKKSSPEAPGKPLL
jgi:hypothetical protein